MDGGAMQALGATGGLLMMFFSVLMMVLSILVPFFIWRIWKWTYATSQELSQLNEKFDQLLTLQQGGAKTIPQPAPAMAPAWNEAPEADEFAVEPATTETPDDADVDPLASAFDVTDAPAAAAAEDAFEDVTGVSTDTVEESGFEFAVSPEDAFGADLEDDLTESGGFEFGEHDGSESEETSAAEDAFADAAGEDDFSFGEEEDSEVASLNQEFDNAFGQTDEPSHQTANADQDNLDGFGQEEDAEEFADDAPAEEDFPPAAPEADLFAAETMDPEPETEAQPDIIALEADPKRPSVSLARCGKCDHKLAYKDSLSGKKARCPSCQSAFVLP